MSLINPDQRDHLKLLRENGTEVAIELCKLALDHLNNGKNVKNHQTIATQLSVSSENVENAVNALVMLQINSIRSNISENDFSITTQNEFTAEQISILWQFITSKKDFMRNILNQIDVAEYHFRDLEWRLEARIASRSLLIQTIPFVTIRLFLDAEIINENKDSLHVNTNDGGPYEVNECRKKEILFQTDPNNLVYLIEIFEKALDEAKTHRIRNITKTF